MVVWDKKIFKGIFWKMFTNEDKIDDLWIQKNRNGCYNLKIWLRTEILKKRLFWIDFLKVNKPIKARKNNIEILPRTRVPRKPNKAKKSQFGWTYYMNKMPIKTNKN